MNNLFSKITVLFLMIAIFFMATGLCVNSLLNFKIETQVVKAAASSDTCNDEAPVQTTSHHNSVLPCCVGESHPIVLTIFQSAEIIKFIPISFFTENQILKIAPQALAYSVPIFSPPELLSLKSTILRI